MLRRIVAEAFELAERDGPAARARLGQALELLDGKPDDAKPRPPERPRHVRQLAPWQIRKVTAYVEDNLGRTVRVRDLAALTRLTRGYFSRAFQGSLGLSPQAYIVRRRVDAAERMMLDGDDPLAQIAAACGFYDQSYMSRLFRQVNGVAPAAWRRARRGLDAPAEAAPRGQAARAWTEA